MNYETKLGDIFLCDSDRFAAKAVEFLMSASTLWQWIWRWMLNIPQPCRYYHAGLIFDNSVLVEQQAKFQYGDTQKILSRRITIYRKNSLTTEQQALIKERAIAQLGQGYGIAEVIGHTLTWLTGIKWFLIILGALTRNQDICINRVCRLYNHIDSFGSKYWETCTTLTVDEYCSTNPDWEVVYTN